MIGRYSTDKIGFLWNAPFLIWRLLFRVKKKKKLFFIKKKYLSENILLKNSFGIFTRSTFCIYYLFY